MALSILIADDEPDVLDLVGLHLKAAGFDVLRAADGSEAVEIARRDPPALAVLDVMMPGLNGMEVCRVLKNDTRTERVPVVLLTAKSSQIDRIVAFELGVDDYVTKPFSPRELVLRVQAILRRKLAEPKTDRIMRAGPIVLDRDRHEVTVGNHPVDLTAIEFKLLTVLMERADRVQTREALLGLIWGEHCEVEIRTVDTHMRRLRDKLGRAGDQIHTVRGFGYRLSVE